MSDFLDTLASFAKSFHTPPAEPAPAASPWLGGAPAASERKPAVSQLSDADQLLADVAQIRAANSDPDAMALFTLSRQRNNDLTANNRIVKDWETLSPFAFHQRYGQEIVDQMSTAEVGGGHVRDLAATPRSVGQHVADGTLDVASGAVQAASSLGSVAMLPFGKPGAWLAGKNAELAGWMSDKMTGMQSSELGRLRYVDALRGELDRQDNNNLYEDQRKQDGDFVAGLRSFGRGTLEGSKRLLEDPAMLESGVAQGLGSMLVAGPASRAVTAGAKVANAVTTRAIGVTGSELLDNAGAKAIEEAVKKISFPLTVGAMEGGGAFNQTYQDVAGTSLEELRQNSPAFRELTADGKMTPEDARQKLATDASSIAFWPAGVTGALTGKLVERFETHPFAKPTPGTMLGNAGREFTEEFAQSGAGQFATNLGKQTTGVDPNINLAEGVGEQALQGAIFGAGSVGVTQGPRVALTQTGKAAGATLKAAVRPLLRAGENVLAGNEADSPVAPEKAAAEIKVAVEQAPQVAQDLRVLAAEAGTKDSAGTKDYITKIEQAVGISGEDLAAMPASLIDAVQQASHAKGELLDRFELLNLVANAVADDAAPTGDRIAAAAFLDEQVKKQRQLFAENVPDFMENVSHDRPEYQRFEAYSKALTALDQVKTFAEGLKFARDNVSMDGKTADDVSPQQLVDVATHAPQQLNEKLADEILQQADTGKLTLTPKQRRIIEGALALKNADRVGNAKMRLVEPGQVAAGETGTDFIARQIKTEGGGKTHQWSLAKHVAGINAAADAGNVNQVKNRIRLLGRFGQSLANKVAAFNTAIQNGDRKKVSYQALGPDGSFLPADNRFQVFYNPGSQASEKLARQVEAEAAAAITLANDFAKQYPEYGISNIEIPTLKLSGADENISTNNIGENTSKGADVKRGSSTEAKPASKSQATTSGTDTVQKQLELPLAPPAPVEDQILSEHGNRQNAKEFMTALLDAPEKQFAAVIDNKGRLWNISGLGKKLGIEGDHAALFDTLKKAGIYPRIATNAAGETSPTTVPYATITAYGNGIGVELIVPLATDKQQAMLRSLKSLAEREGMQFHTIEVTPTFEPSRTRGYNDEQLAALNAQRDTDIATENSVGPARQEQVVENTPAAPDKGAVPETKADIEDNQPKKKSKIAERFSSLVQAAGQNWFHKSFRLAKQQTSRLIDLERPLQDLYGILGKNTKLREFLAGKEPSYDLMPKHRIAFRMLIEEQGAAVLKALHESLAKKAGQKLADGSTIFDQLLAGDEKWLRSRDTRVLNLLDRDGDKLGYNPQLIESAVLAGLDWALTAQERVSRLDTDDVANILGVEASAVDGTVVDAFNNGLSMDMAARTLADNIVKFWGLDKNPNANDAYAKGIVEGLAKEMLLGLTAAGLVSIPAPLKFPEHNNKSYGRVWFNQRSDDLKQLIDTDIGGTARFLSDLALVDPEHVLSVGKPVEDISEKQLHNPLVDTTRQQKKAMAAIQATAYKPNLAMFDFVQALGKQAFVALHGGQAFEAGKLNVNHEASVVGKNRTLEMAFDTIEKQIELVRLAAQASNKPVEQMPVFYKFETSKAGRLQMVGAVTPQSDKYAREVFMATGAVLDLSSRTGADFARFAKTVGQGIGIKTEQQYGQQVVDKVIAETMTAGGQYRPLVEALKTWLTERENGNGKSLPQATIAALFAQKGLSNHGINSLLAVARYELAGERGADLSRFETPNYLEADGKTNGIINALMLFAAGSFGAQWFKNIGKGGVFIGRQGRTLNEHFNEHDNEDAYQTVALKTDSNVAARGHELAGSSPEAFGQFQAFWRMVQALGLDISVSMDADGMPTVSIDRKATKNPSTITVYGSGVDGIAGKFTGELVGLLYEKLSEVLGGAASFGAAVYGEDGAAQFRADITALVTQQAAQNDEGEWGLGKAKANAKPRSQDETSERQFTFTRQELNALKQNVRAFLIEPMHDAINSEVMGSVRATTEMVQKATQLQSIVLRDQFLQQIGKALAAKMSDPEANGWRPGDFLSRSDIDQVYKALQKFAPYIDAGSQRYMLSGSERSSLPTATDQNGKPLPLEITLDGGRKVYVAMPEDFSRTLDGKLSTPAYLFAPTLAGVRAIPLLTIGSGDGQMMLNGLSENPELAARTLPTFDGLQMPADAMEAFSTQINKAVYDSWFRVNNLRAVSNSYNTMLRAVPAEFSEQALLDISRTFHNKRSVSGDEIFNAEQALIFMHTVGADLSDNADNNDARLAVLKKMPMTIDQMASAESPYVHAGEIEIPADASDDQILGIMQAEYQKIRGQFYTEPVAYKPGDTQAAAPEPESKPRAGVEGQDAGLVEAIDMVASPDESGARVVYAKNLDWFTNPDVHNLTPGQRGLTTAALERLKDSGYQVVFGNQAELDAWEQVYNADRFTPGSNNGYGKIDPVSKIILISNIATETIIHELVHAATLDKVRAAYANPEALSQQDRAAVERLEGLMQEWLVQDFGQADALVQDAHRQAQATVVGKLNQNRTADAVNEFMAWVLGNQHLAKMAKATKVSNPLFRVIGSALQALKQLVFGKSDVTIGDDMLSNLRFNTQVLMATPSPVEMLKQDFNAVALYHAPGFGSNDRLLPIRDALNRKIVAYTRDAANPAEKLDRTREAYAATRDGDDMARVFASHFPGLGTMQGYSTFTAMQAALMVDAELNPNALARVEELYSHAIGKLDRIDFQVDPTGSDPNDVRQAQDKLDALSGQLIGKTDSHGRSTLMSSFLALAVVDDGFREILAKVDKPKSDKNEAGTLDAGLENLANAGMDRLTRLLSGERADDKNVQQALDRLVQTMIENVGDQRSFIEQNIENSFDKLENYVASGLQKLSGAAANKARAVIADPNQHKLVKGAARVVRLGASLVNEQEAAAVGDLITRFFNTRSGLEGFRALANDLISAKTDITELISKARAHVSQTRQNYRLDLPIELAKKFSRKLSKPESTALYKGIGKSDLAALTASHGARGALTLATDSALRTAEIQTKEAAIKALEPRRFARLQAKAKQYANFMNSGQRGSKLLKNATAIAHLYGEHGHTVINTKPGQLDQLIGHLDELISLYALDGLDQASKDTLAALNKDERDGVEFMLSYIGRLRSEENSKITNGIARINHYKGYIPSEKENGGNLIIASDNDFARLKSLGYTRLGAYSGSSADRSLGKRSYYFSPVSGRAPYSQGVLQTVHQTVAGIDPRTGYSVGEVMAGRIEDPRLVQAVTAQLANQRATAEHLQPVYNDSGAVIAYERTADPAQLASLERSTDLGKMAGAWHGRQVEEELGQEINKVLLDKLHTNWSDGQKAGRQNEYVNLARAKDPVHQDAWNMIPDATKTQIKLLFGDGKFMVRRDMLIDAVGERQASIGDLFTGNGRWDPKTMETFKKIAIGSFGNDAFNKLLKSERLVQDLVFNAKHLIVVKSVIVPAANLISNMVQLANRGVPLRAIFQGMGAKTVEINSYIQGRAREIRLEVELAAARDRKANQQIQKLENELTSLRDGYRRMSIWPLIEGGQFSSISNGHVTAEDLALADGRWGNYIDKLVAKVPEGVTRTAARYAFVTRDTALYQGLARATQYGDFIAKAVLYDDLVKRKKMNKAEAIGMVEDAFVNYNRLAGRNRQYLESVGLLWFFNYKLRIVKEAAYMLRHHPLRSLLLSGLPVGGPVDDNIFSVVHDGRLGYALGPSMGMHAFSLNPWVNLVR